jgi:nitrite reductase/ring-hydroxylating ferredoxin subunit
MTAVEVGDTALVVANVEGTLLAYRNACASCAGRLDTGVLSAGALTCPSCGRSFFLPRAGRSLDDERIQLDPVPLLREQGGVRVALSP